MRHVAAGVLIALLGLATASGAADPAPPRAQPTRPPTGPDAERHAAVGERGAIAAGGAEAVAAGLEILRAGGNAADAAAATLLAQTVTDADNYCFGGEVPILVFDARRGVVEVLAGQGAAPRLATPEHFAGRPHIPLRGPEPAAVPAAPDAILTLLARFGTKPFAEVAAPALRILDRREFPWHADLAATLRLMLDAERQSPDRLRGLRLAADCLYRGPIARRLDAWARANGCLLRYEDLAAHVTRIEEPVIASYRGHAIAKCGPWTQGPALLQALQLLDGSDLKAAGAGSADAIHLGAEALKLALADRDAYYADPIFVDVPLAELLAPGYAASRRPLIDPKRASLELRPGDPRGSRPLRAGGVAGLYGATRTPLDTTTCVVADGAGNVVAATPSGWSVGSPGTELEFAL